MTKIKAKDSLFILLSISAAIVLFPTLGRVGLQPDERYIADLATQFSGLGVTGVFEGHGEDFTTNFYAYLVSIVMNLSNMPIAYAVRIPSATIILALTLGMFRFRGKNEKLSKAFLAALLFLSSYMVSSLAYHATPISIMSLTLIFSLSALYHWIKEPSTQKFYLTIATTACASIFLGILAPITVLALGIVFMLLQDDRGRISRYVKLAAISLAATILAYGILIFITNDTEIAGKVIGVEQITRPLAEYAKIEIFVKQVVFSIFPWSIPIIVALGWIACNPSWLKNKFLALSLLKQFGAILFLLSIPSFFALNRLSLVMLLTSIFFNMPVISSFLLSQIHNHTVTWRITGSIFAGLIALFLGIFIAVRFGAKIHLFGYSLSDAGEWSVWSVMLVATTITGLYTLWRSQRTIRFNNRYLYNIVILYLLAQLLYKAYINPSFINV